ncbi:MAG TPA: TRAM domain-containing protein [Pirellulaceae bacterium]|nr:TRAM domain-containing protein [Pirellulaceae bacterium]
MPLIVLRIVCVAVAMGIATLLIGLVRSAGGPGWLPWVAFLTCAVVAASVIAADIFLPRKRIDVISAIYFGLAIGFFLTFVAMLALTPLLQLLDDQPIISDSHLFIIRTAMQLLLGLVLCYTCISVLMQTKDDFRFIIPYVEFSKEVKGLKPYVLDTSVVIDGRIADLVETNVLDNQLIMPRFVLSELQAIADSGDKLRRARGRRGLDILNRLRNNQHIDLKIHDHELPEMSGQPVDMKLVLLAKHLEGKIVTGDYNLNKVARLHNVAVINLNDIANSLKPVFLPGETLDVRIVKPGEEMGQGVGYLDDGTMIVVEGGREHIGKEVKVNVTSVLQTSAGRMIFGKAIA